MAKKKTAKKTAKRRRPYRGSVDELVLRAWEFMADAPMVGYFGDDPEYEALVADLESYAGSVEDEMR